MDSQNTSFPNSMKCPITNKVMNDPVMDSEGNTFERSAIEEWLVTHGTSPISRNAMAVSDLVPNRGLRNAIDEFRQRQPSQATGPAPPIGSTLPDAAVDKPLSVELIGITDSIASSGDSDETTVIATIGAPEGKQRVPMDVCCVIDVSSSMNGSATIKDKDGVEKDDGLSLMDIVKHAVATITHSLNEDDRLSVVTFATNASTLFDLQQMTTKGKQTAVQATNATRANGSTNLWDGLLQGIKVIQGGAKSRGGRAPVIYLLTDGCPNMEPPRGSHKALASYLANNPECNDISINTFGFGYNLDSKLLVNIAECGHGTYSFIPDPGFVGTVFVHTMANTSTRVARDIKMKLHMTHAVKVKKGVNESHELAIMKTDKLCPYSATHPFVVEAEKSLACIQYGQQQSILFKIPSKLKPEEDFSIVAHVEWTEIRSGVKCSTTTLLSAKDFKSMKDLGNDTSEAVCQAFFSKMFVDSVEMAVAKCADSKYGVAVKIMKGFCQTLRDRMKQLNIVGGSLQGLLQDAEGQATEAISKDDFFRRWGCHYLPSLSAAHRDSRCNNFKDPGVQYYGGQLFKEVRTQADDMFCSLPAPKPSRRAQLEQSCRAAGRVAPAMPKDMFSYYTPSNGCFRGSCSVTLADGVTTTTVDRLKKGDSVLTGAGTSASVICVMRTRCENNETILIKDHDTGLEITPYHPIRTKEGTWIFPKDLESSTVHKYLGEEFVYTYVLDNGHSLHVNGVECVTLGHSFIDEVVAHEYFGSQEVIEDLKNLDGWQDGLVTLNESDFVRDSKTQKVVGIMAFSPSEPVMECGSESQQPPVRQTGIVCV